MSKIEIRNAVTGEVREITVPAKKRAKKAARPTAKPKAAKPAAGAVKPETGTASG